VALLVKLGVLVSVIVDFIIIVVAIIIARGVAAPFPVPSVSSAVPEAAAHVTPRPGRKVARVEVFRCLALKALVDNGGGAVAAVVAAAVDGSLRRSEGGAVGACNAATREPFLRLWWRWVLVQHPVRWRWLMWLRYETDAPDTDATASRMRRIRVSIGIRILLWRRVRKHKRML
jgi:hypothetical protein